MRGCPGWCAGCSRSCSTLERGPLRRGSFLGHGLLLTVEAGYPSDEQQEVIRVVRFCDKIDRPQLPRRHGIGQGAVGGENDGMGFDLAGIDVLEDLKPVLFR